MSQTLHIEFRGQGFGAFDVTVHILTKHLIDAALAHERSAEPWLISAIHEWRIGAAIPDLGMHLDDAWSPQQVGLVIDLLAHACVVLSHRSEISRDEIESWVLLDAAPELRIYTRGQISVRTLPVIRMGEAIIALLRGTLPEAPPGHWWLFGVDDSPTAIKGQD